MEEVGMALAEQRVAALYLIHGQCGGGDYSEQYARWLESSLHRPGQPWVPVRLFHWSGESHHLGRADGAVRLIEEVAAMDLALGQRVLLWAHDDAGNVLALATRLLTADPSEVERFFQAASVYYRWPVLGCVDIPVWDRVRKRFGNGPVLQGVFLDAVTFGTLACYGWGQGSHLRRLHILDERRVDVPGEDALPARSAWRSRLADRRLGRFLASGQTAKETADRVCRGTIFEEPGATLLIDYGAPSEPQPQDSIYTRQDWLLFHAEEIARRFYAARVLKVA